MRIRAILNPRAGLAAQKAKGAVLAGRPGWPPVELKVTEGPGHARELARESAAREDELCLAVGGDGTVNEVAWGLLGSKTTLGLVPVGSGNGLARSLGLSLRPARALAQLETGVDCGMDVGFINDRPFFNVAGVGLDAAIGMSFHNWGRQGGRRGILPYAWLGVKEAFRFAPRRIRIELANETIEERAWLLTIANGRQYGGGAVITPQALLDDGQLRAVVIRAIPFVALLGAIPLLLAGWLHKMPFYRVWTANTLRFRVDVPCEHHRDGEPEPAGQDFHVRVEPRAMSVRVPQQIFASGHRTFLAGPQ